MRRLLHKLTAGLALSALGAAAAPRFAELLQGQTAAHDPSTIVKCGGEYWVFATGRNLLSRHSRDLRTWQQGPQVFTDLPAWTSAAVPGNRGHLWAPDIIRVGNRYLLYYSLELADRLGTMSDAVAFAADQVKITTYDVRVVPEPKNFLEELLEQWSGGKDEPGHVALGTGEESLLRLAAPLLQNLDPQRTAAVVSVLTRLEILQKEGLVLTMPEILAK